MVKTGKKVKNFSRPATGDKTISLKELAGKKVVLYFYPKDFALSTFYFCTSD